MEVGPRVKVRKTQKSDEKKLKISLIDLVRQRRRKKD
jgi:hypothetical protein